MNENKRILIIPDAVKGSASGAIVTQVLIRLIRTQNYSVGVFSCDLTKDEECQGIKYYQAIPYTGIANFRSGKYRKSFVKVINDFNPTHVFFVGSITNKPLCYLNTSIKRKLKTEVFIFMQDFFCAKYYANTSQGPCTKCLDKNLYQIFFAECGVENIGRLKLVERYITRVRLKKILCKVDNIITSTQQQLSFYEKFGVNLKNARLLPLLFDSSKTKELNIERGSYFVGIAQNRVEKGFQFMPNILKHTSAKIVLAFYNDKQKNEFENSKFLKKYIEEGNLTCVVKSWDTGLGELIANSQGVVIPSIWPTTTEFGLLEALALKKPVITFDVGIHKEVIRNGENGFVSPIGNFKHFASNLNDIDNLSKDEYNKLETGVQELYKLLISQKLWIEFLKEM